MSSSAQIAIGSGKIRNSMGFLTKDLTGLYPEKFLNLTHLKPVQASRSLEVPRPNLYKSIIPLKPSTKLKERVLSLVMATDIAFELFGRNLEETANWFMAPNILLFGASPFEICMRGDGNQLIQWLLDRAGVDPAPIKK